jgi:hypothetical protein
MSGVVFLSGLPHRILDQVRRAVMHPTCHFGFVALNRCGVSVRPVVCRLWMVQ